MTVGYDGRFSHGDYGIWVPTGPDRAKQAADVLRRTARWRCGMSAERAMHIRRAGALALTVALTACSWFTDFKEQPKYDPWESPHDSIPMRGNPQNSVSIYGSAAPGYAVSRASCPARSTPWHRSRIRCRPTRSLSNGRKQYAINCAVCHGDTGKGDGPIVPKGFPGIPLVAPRRPLPVAPTATSGG